MHAHINKCSVKRGLMPVKDPNESVFFLFFFPFFFFIECTVAYGQWQCVMSGKQDHYFVSLFKVLSLPGSPELPRCARVLV